MSVFRLGSGTEFYRFVAAIESDIKPRQESMHVCVKLDNRRDEGENSNLQSFRVTESANGAVKDKSSFFAVRRSICCIGYLISSTRPDSDRSSYFDSTRVCNYGLQLNGIDQRFSQSNILDTRIVKPIHVIPD